MIAASDLYAPQLEQGVFSFSHQNNDYWCREIPLVQAKVKTLKTFEAKDLTKSAAVQLAKAHKKTVNQSESLKLLAHLEAHFKEFESFCELFHKNLNTYL